MNPKLVSLKPKPTIPSTGKTPTNVESNPAYSDKTAFPTIARKDDLPVKRKPSPDAGDDERKRESAPIQIHREPNFARRTQRGYSARQTTSRTQPPRVSRAFEFKFNTLVRRQKNLIQQTKLEGQLEYLTVSQSGTGQYWITVEGTGKPFIRIPFETPEYCFECALDLEDTFEILQVIELRPPETIERIEEMVGVYLDRERVARIWG
ncbi:hypothetical protein [Acaryochloris sp. CCMEE 5410]|uniref:hypothetical protein n=1 Tax=Acaryochloris sp. CCMEE 5410 TaxID=310037 RepID=UPI000248470A|nr:hypothetical protein [Acaryochloris sp. CCMEE 5410]KAI9129296.1 hypothetical protein ON05_034700 [Acaryochloris sp. CCMEE 5410]